MKFERFEEILSWQKAQDLSIAIYLQTKNMKDLSFRDQLQRASVSIMNNIAEGFERGSNKDFCKFLYIAKGSCGEVRSMLDLAEKLGYLTTSEKDVLYSQSVDISKLLAGLIKSIKE